MLRINVQSIQTTDATVTVFWQKAVAINTMFRIKGEILARKSDRAAGYTCSFEGIFRRASAGSLVLVGTPIVTPIEDSSGTPAVTITASSNNARINVQGIVSETWDWKFVNLEYSSI